MKTRLLLNTLLARGRNVCQWSAIALGILVLSACATSQPDTFNSETLLPAAAPDLTRPDGAVRLDTDNEEIARLWASAERARVENKPTIALELLYEAMDIDSQNSLLWSRAAEYKLDSVEPALAERYAQRSNELAGENRPLLHRNWLIIKHARSMRGDLLGERGANQEAMLYQPLR